METENDEFDMSLECPECGVESDYQSWYPREDGLKCPDCGVIVEPGDFA